MKIGILTLPIMENYGGAFQAAALSRALHELGHETYLLRPAHPRPWPLKLATRILQILPGQNLRGIREREMIRRRHLPFVRQRFDRISPMLRGPEDYARYARKQSLDAIIVGSDQVWRTDFIIDYRTTGSRQVALENYFLDFGPSYKGLRISYAPSFGSGEWRMPDKRDEVAKRIRNLDAVSCRELSGTALLKSEFGREDAQTVLDPTMIVPLSFYDEGAAPPEDRPPYVLRYVLDESPVLQNAAAHVVEGLGQDLDVRTISIHQGDASLSLAQWLRAFMDADFVVTDSFHGTVFSILFKKNFVAIGNRERGIDRFVSLLDQTGLSDRLLLEDDPARAQTLAETPIDYSKVEERLTSLRHTSLNFLKTALKGERA